MDNKERLVAYYQNTSKHSNYQSLPKAVLKLLPDTDVSTTSRHEEERLAYITSKIDFKDKSVVDIGGNTGYFTFGLLEFGAKSVTHLEGNVEHSKFVQLASNALDFSDKIPIINKYYDFDQDTNIRYDIGLLFNVLHHTGDDYGRVDTITKVKEQIAKELNSMSDSVQTLVFQLGFNWMGNPNKPIFTDGTKKEMIDFVTGAIVGNWEISSIGIATGSRSNVVYTDVNEENIKRDDSMGEFLNRPIFILRSKK